MALRDLTALRPDRLPFAPLARCDEAELMDMPDQDEAELAENLRDIRRVNHLLGGTAIILRHLPILIASIPPTQAISVLDLATGSGDIPLAISRWAKRHGTAMTIVASDLSEPILREARKQLANHPKITLAKYDARAVPTSVSRSIRRSARSPIPIAVATNPVRPNSRRGVSFAAMRGL